MEVNLNSDLQARLTQLAKAWPREQGNVLTHERAGEWIEERLAEKQNRV